MKKSLIVLAVLLFTALPVFGQSSPTTDVDRRANSILSKMTLEQKLDYIGGYDRFFIRSMPQLGLPALKMADGPIGVRNYGPSTTYAGGIALAASWNPQLARRVGTMIGHDARARGVNIMLGPGVNIYRAPMAGRNFEYFGEDPFLASRIVVGYIEGMQSQGVSATVKHYMGNNSEFLRHDSDSVIDERAMREIYLPAFETAVKEAHVGAIMDSYNLVNGEHATQNSFLNDQIAKKEWGFDGPIMSDWTSTYDAVAAANGGLDLEMPFGKFMNKENLLPAISAGRVNEATIDDKVRRILRKAIQFGWLDRDPTDLNWPAYSEESKQIAQEAAEEGIVLLKNDGNLLPLDRKKSPTIAVIGPGAYPGVPVGGGSAQVQPFETVSFLKGIADFVGTSARVTYSRAIPTIREMAAQTNFMTAASNGQEGLTVEQFSGADLSGTPISTLNVKHVNLTGSREGDLTLGELEAKHGSSTRWSGYYDVKTAGSYTIFVQGNGEGGGTRLFLDGKKVIDDWQMQKALVDETTLNLDAGPHRVVLETHRANRFGERLRLGIIPLKTIVDEQAKALAQKADVVVLALGFDPETEREGADRSFQLPPAQEQLIQEIAAVNQRTVVVVTSGGNVDMQAWVDKVPGLIEAWYPGQEGGTALAKILFGEVNPSGHLPVTFERRWEDNPVHDNYYPEPGTNKVTYREGIFVGYRGYEKNHVKPQFPFGYGLSYTTFKYANLNVTPTQVSFDVTNTGQREGSSVSQVYVGSHSGTVPRPLKELKGFAKVNLKSGETQHINVPLSDRSFSYYDTSAKEWRVTPGIYDVMVGSSSEHIELRGTITR